VEFRRLQAEVLLLVLLLTACGASTSRTKDDATLSTLVKIELLNDPQVGMLRLDAKTAHGVVTLSGTVRSQAEADRAMAVAKRIKGVREVKNGMTVVPRTSLLF
jgi:hyperosmotically inducible protein